MNCEQWHPMAGRCQLDTAHTEALHFVGKGLSANGQRWETYFLWSDPEEVGL